MRVGFFGDSYVEAIQVPLEDKFSRRLPEYISDTRFEYFGFGFSGWGTVHSYLNSQQWVDLFNIDVIIYVFVENDPGDNISWIKKSPYMPYAYKIDSNPGFAINRDFEKNRKMFLHEFISKIKSKSILIQAVWARTSLLFKEGVKLGINEDEKEMKTESKNEIPNENGLAVNMGCLC